MNVLNDIERQWTEHEVTIERRIQRWAECLREGRERFEKARRTFHQWEPLRVYVSTNQVMKAGPPTFSLRYQGQEVGTVVCPAGEKPSVLISPPKQRVNWECFGVLSDVPTRFAWDSVPGRQFREHSKGRPSRACPSQEIREHDLESTVIKEMRRETAAKFDGRLSQLQPVLLYGILPFQVPVPFSASRGKPESSPRAHGNIDILARRRGDDRRVRLAVWELKRPGCIDHAVAQSFIYAVTLRHMLRSSSGTTWFQLFGFERPLPRRLEIESVVMVSEDMRGKYEDQIHELLACNATTIDQDRITFGVAFYDGCPPRFTSFIERVAE